MSDPCNEIGPRLVVRASSYSERAVILRTRRGTKRCLVVDFAGVMPAGRSIALAEFRMFESFTGHMSNPRIDGTQAIVDLDARGLGQVYMRVDATLDNGDRYPVVFELHITGAPWFPDETFPGSGPTYLSATPTVDVPA